ncbi:MAG: family 1 glycosylhydrolase, partial [Oligoflexia bacterium]|nr:family 1 glycosylhydrolase [Oligoflexia bacterium]
MRTFLFIGIFLSIVTINFPAHSQTKQYPKSFLWGAAFSAHQTEGVTGGGENGDWYQFEHPATENSPIANGDNADLSIDHWNRYEDDLQAAKSTGLNTIRISLSWEKIEPQPGIFNSEVMAHYKTVLKRMRELGLRPMISLHHFTHPIWFNQNGGWLSAQSPEYFARYAQYVAQNLSDVCGLWMTFNDPMGFIHLAYVNGEIPPHKKGLSNGFEAAFNTVRAHRLAVYAFHKARSTNNVGVAYGFKLFDPFDLKNEQDVRAAKELSEISNWAWLRATETGHLEFRYTQPGIIWDKQIIFQRNILTSEMILHAKIDWLGVNFYDHSLVRGTTKPIPFELINTQGLEGDNGSTLAPQALEKITRL